MKVADSATLLKLAATAGLKVRYGSDSSNYYEWSFDRAELLVGWDRIFNLTSSNPDSTTGTPALAAMDFFEFVMTSTNAADTWAAGEVIFDHLEVGSGTLYAHNSITSILKTDDIQLYLDETITITVTQP